MKLGNLFKKDPSKNLRKSYQKKLEEAMLAQRKGDIRTYSMLTAEAESIYQELQSVEKAAAS